MLKKIITAIKKTIYKKGTKKAQSKLAIITDLEHQVVSLNKNNKSFYNKTIPKEAIDSVFKKLDNGELSKYLIDRTVSRKEPDWITKGRITQKHSLRVFPLTKSSLGTFRILKLNQLKLYLECAKRFYSEVNKYQNHFENFKIQPINILDVRKLKSGNYALLEKVQPAITVYDLSSDGWHNNNRFTKNHLSFLKSKVNIDSPEFKTLIKKAYNEYVSKLGENTGIDHHKTNVLVLDYDPIEKKLLFGPIDFTISCTQSLP